MSYAYLMRPLTEERIDLAYLLVGASGCGVKQSDWKAFCKRVIECRGGPGLHDDVTIALDAAGHIKGLFVIEVMQSMLFGRVLDVPMFIAASAGDEDGIILDLLEAVKAKAQDAKCSDVRIWTQGGDSWVRVTADSPVASHYKGVQLKIVA